ncbi:MAG: divergent polysaccharide deacetylase family protein [Candidatus Muiribacteriota bacterium]
MLDWKLFKITGVYLALILIVFSVFQFISSEEDTFKEEAKIYEEKEDAEKPRKEYKDEIISFSELEESLKQQKSEKKEAEKPKKSDVKNDSYKIALIVDDLGYGHENKFNLFERLKDYKMTLAVIPGTFNALYSEKKGHDYGYELMLHIPMQAKGVDNAYENEIKTDMTPDEFHKRLEEMFEPFSHIEGANNHMGSLATEDKKTMLNVLSYLKKNNMFFIDSLTTSNTAVKEASERLNLNYYARNIFLDNIADEIYILKQFNKLKDIARRRGFAIGICHVREKTLSFLENMLPQIEDDPNFELVYVSEIVKKKKTLLTNRNK